MFKKLLIFILVTLSLGAVLNFATAQSDQNPQSFVENLVRSFVVADGRDVRFDELNISLSGNVTAKGVAIFDDEGEWLKVTGLALDWSPLSLLGSTVQVNSFSVASIDVKRLPKTSAPASSVSEVNPKPFVLKAFDLKNITLAEAVAGQAVSLKASGTAQAALDPTVIAVDVSASRTDNISGSLITKISYSPQQDTLTLDVVLEEAANGVLTRILPIDGEPEIKLAVKGDGNLDDWSGALDLRLDSDQVMKGEMTIVGKSTERQIDFDFSGNMARLVPASARVFVEGRSELTGSLKLLKDGKIDIRDVLLRSSVAAFQTKGILDTETDKNDVRFAAILEPKGRATLKVNLSSDETLQLGAADLAGNLTGTLGKPIWSIRGAVASAQYNELELREIALNGSADASSSSTINDIALKLSGDLISGISDDWPKSFTGPFNASMSASHGKKNPIAVNSADLTFDDAVFSVDGAIVPSTGLINMTFDARVADLMRGQGGALSKLFNGNTTLTGNINRKEGSKFLTLETVQLENPSLSAGISGSYTPQALDITGKAVLKDLNRLSEQAKGSLNFDLTLQGDPNAPVINTQLTGDAISLSNKRLEKLNGRLKGILSSTKPDIALDITGRYRNAPIAAKANVKTKIDGKRVIEDILLTVAGADISGDLELTAEDNLPVGSMQFDVTDFSTLGDLLLTTLKGSLNGFVTLTNEASLLNAAIEAKGSGLVYETLSAGTLDIAAAINDVTNTLKPSGKITAANVLASGNALGRVDVVFDKFDEGYLVNLSSDGRDVSLLSKAIVKLEPQATRVTVQSAKGMAQSVPFNLVQPSQIVIEQGETILSPITLAIGGGQLTAQGTLSPKLSLKASASALPLSIADALDGALDLNGTLNGQVQITQKEQHPDVEFDATITDFSTAATRDADLPPLSIVSTGNTRANILNLRSSIEGPQNTSFTLNGTAGISGLNALDLKLLGTAPLSLIADHLARQGVRLEGRSDVDINIRGNAGNPQIGGAVKLVDATAGDVDGRLIIRNLNGTAIIADDRVRVTALNGEIGQNGTVQGRGILQLDDGLQTDFNVQIQNGTYTDETLVVATFNADLSLKGALARSATLGGNIDLLSTLITLNVLPVSAIKIGDVVHIRPPRPVAKQQALINRRDGSSSSSGGGIFLDLKIADTNPIFVRGRGINADFSGVLRLSGPSSAPNATGQFNLRRGTIDIIGQTLTFDRGSFTFAGSLTPRIDVAASNSVSGSTVTLGLVGPAETPEVVISSSPEIPDEEALALLVFSRQASDLSPLQLARLADALLTLSGGRQTSLFEAFRQGLGVDRLDVSTDEDGNSALGVGRYINNRTYFGVEQGIESRTTRATINLDITKKLKLQGSVGTDGETKAGIIFQHEY